MTLSQLLTACDISNWHRAQWFTGAVLSGQTLAVSDEDAAGFIRRCWLAKMQGHLPGLTVTVKPKPIREANSLIPASKQRRYQAWKAAEQGRLVE